MMFRTCRTTRWLVTASLIVSLGLTGLFPRMIVRADQGVRVSSQEQPTQEKPAKCCCGTKDGRCCGMGCCVDRQSPSKEPCPFPNKRENRDGRSNPFAMAAAKALFECGNAGRGSLFGCPFSNVDRSRADSSLQARHVRIDA